MDGVSASAVTQNVEFGLTHKKKHNYHIQIILTTPPPHNGPKHYCGQSVNGRTKYDLFVFYANLGLNYCMFPDNFNGYLQQEGLTYAKRKFYECFR